VAIKASNGFYDRIKGKEGFRENAYPDGTQMSAGYGVKTDNPERVVTRDQADKDMRAYVANSEASLSSMDFGREFTQAQQDVLLDIDYNMKSESRQKIYNYIKSGATDSEIQAKLLEYNKGDNTNGESVKMGGLVTRSQDRSNMWGSMGPASAPLMAEEIPVDDDMMSAINQAKEGPTEEDDFSSAIAQAKEGEAEEITPKGLSAQMAIMAATATPERVKMAQEAKKLSILTGMSQEASEAKLSNMGFNDAVVESKRNLVAKYNQPVARWAAKSPENYELMKNTGDYTRKIDNAAQAFNPDKMSDAEKVYTNQKIFITKAWVQGQMALGTMTWEEGIVQLNHLDTQTQTYSESAGLEAITKADGVLNILAEMAKNPGATGTFAMEGIGSSLLPMASSVVGIAGFASVPFTGPIGVTAGITGTLGAFAAGGLLSFGEKMQDLLSDYADPKTGKIDYVKAGQDPQKLSLMRKEASLYGGIMGASDAVIGLTGGLLLKYTVKKAVAKTVMGKMAVFSTGAIAEGTLNAAGEGGSQLAASNAADLYGGRLTPEKKAENIKEAKLEMVASILPGAAFSSVGYGARTIYKSEKLAALATGAKIKTANAATQAAAAVSNLRASVMSDSTGQTSPDQIKDLINESMAPGAEVESVHAPMDVDLKPGINKEIQAQDRASNSHVSISPSEWEAYHMKKGVDSLEAMNSFTPQALKDYMSNRVSDTSFQVPMADWIIATESDPMLETIARFNGNEFNAVEAQETVEALEKNPYDLFDRTNDSETDVDSTPDDSIEIIEPTEAGDNIISRPVELTSKYRDAEERKVFKSLVSRLKQANDKSFAPEMVEVFADAQLRHMRMRAKVTGQTMEQVASRLQIGKTTKKESNRAHGIFKPNQMPGGVYTIVFAPTSTPKTIVHEFGHSWLHEMAEDWKIVSVIPEDKLTPDQKEYKTAMETAADLLGRSFGMKTIDELLTLRGDRYAQVHESFAQTTERYFLDGKFDDNRIRALMEVFRKWINEVADAIRQMTYPQYPPLKMTPEVERMFSAILGVSNRIEEEVIPMFPVPMFDPEMLGPEGVKYGERIADARSLAIGSAYHKSFAQSIKDREKLILQEQDRIIDMAVEEVDAMPSMQTLRDFESAYGEHKNDPEGDTPDPRLSYESVLQTILGGSEERMEALRKTLPRAVMTGKKKGGMDVSLYMQMKRISDPAEMFEQLVEMGMRQDFINQTFDELLKTEIPVMKSDEEVHQIAVDAVNSRGAEKLMQDELKILATKFLPTLKGLAEKAINPAEYIAKGSKENITARGQELVRDSLAYRFSANKFLMDSQRHGRQAARLFRTGDFMGSFDSKFKEAIHYYAYKAARDAQNDVAETKVRINNLKKYSRSKDHLKVYDFDMMRYGRQIVQIIKMKGDVPPLTAEMFNDISGVTGDSITRINDAVTDFQQQAGGKAGENLTVGGYTALGELVKAIMKEARISKKIEVDNKIEQLDTIKGQVVEDFDRVGNVVDFTKTSYQSKKNASLVNMSTLMEGFYKNTGDFVKSAMGKMLTGVRDQEAKLTLHKNEVDRVIVKAVRKAVKNNSAMEALYAPILRRLPFVSLDKNMKPIHSPELKVTFQSMNQLDAFMMNLGSESGAKKILLGGFNGSGPLSFMSPKDLQLDMTKTMEFIERLISEGVLTAERFEMYQTIWDEFAKLHPELKREHRKSSSFEIGNIEARPLTTSLGVLKGGYFPSSKSRVLDTIAKFESLVDPDANSNYRVEEMYPKQNTGMTNERTQTYYDSELDMSKVPQYLSAVMNIIYLRNPMMDLGKVLSSQEVHAALEAKRPGALKNVILPWFEDTSGQIFTKPGSLDQHSIARKFRQNANIAIYSFNSMVAFKQLLGHFPAMKEVNPGRMLLASAQQSFSPVQTREFITSKSALMKNRLNGSMQQLGRSTSFLDTRFDWINGSEIVSRDISSWAMQMFQNYTDVNVWMAAYNQALDSNLSEKQAALQADLLVDKTQVATGVSGMSNFQRGEDIYKVFTMALSYKLAIRNLFSVEMQRDTPAAQKAAVIALLGVIALYIPMIFDSIISEAVRAEGDDEADEEKQRKRSQRTLALRAIMAPIEGPMPIMGGLVSSAMIFGSANPSAAFGVLSKVPSAIAGANHKRQGVPLSDTEVTALISTATLLTGFVGFEALGAAIDLSNRNKPAREKRREAGVRRRKLAKVKRQE